MDNIIRKIAVKDPDFDSKSLNAMEIVANLFAGLMDREKDVISRRFGLFGDRKETLKKVGSTHGLTRERVRQIEAASIGKIRKLDKLEEHVGVLRQVIRELIVQHGGLVERDFLLDILVLFLDIETAERNAHKNHLDFIITKLLNEDFEKISKSENFKTHYRLKSDKVEHLDEIVVELAKKVSDMNRTLDTQELIDHMKNSETYQRHSDKFSGIPDVDIAHIYENENFPDDGAIINENKHQYSLITSARNIEQNRYGHWGIHNWSEVRPKTVNDKIYLVLKNHGQPLHFTQIAEHINAINFDKKNANPATVHNELILDLRYVLVGRGIYGLKDWGYKEGMVVDVVKDVLANADHPLTLDEVAEKVLVDRIVKKTTIMLALMNKDIFEKKDGKYMLKQ